MIANPKIFRLSNPEINRYISYNHFFSSADARNAYYLFLLKLLHCSSMFLSLHSSLHLPLIWPHPFLMLYLSRSCFLRWQVKLLLNDSSIYSSQRLIFCVRQIFFIVSSRNQRQIVCKCVCCSRSRKIRPYHPVI